MHACGEVSFIGTLYCYMSVNGCRDGSAKPTETIRVIVCIGMALIGLAGKAGHT